MIEKWTPDLLTQPTTSYNFSVSCNRISKTELRQFGPPGTDGFYKPYFSVWDQARPQLSTSFFTLWDLDTSTADPIEMNLSTFTAAEQIVTVHKLWYIYIWAAFSHPFLQGPFFHGFCSSEKAKKTTLTGFRRENRQEFRLFYLGHFSTKERDNCLFLLDLSNF